jgi:membrane associated rhomboid family serine protease
MIPLYDDREDYREPWRFPVMTVLLIVANVLVFAGWQLRLGLVESVKQAGFLPHEFTSYPLSIWSWRYVFTSMFMHGGFLHLLGNMWFLWVFGDDIEEHCGAIGYLFLYLLSGVAAVLAFTLVAPHADVPLVGASGAISGVLGAYFLQRPDARITTLFFFPCIWIRDIPGLVFLLYWIVLQVIAQVLASRAHNVEHSGVAYAAHIGGFIAGLILINVFQKTSDDRR